MEAAGHTVAKTTGVGEPCTMIEPATYAMAEAARHAMTQAVAEFAVATIVGFVGAVG